MSEFKRRAIIRDTEFKTREAEDGKKFIEGYFAIFGAQYQLWDRAYETVDQGAFDLERDQDVRALTNHDTTLVLGRTTAGTLRLSTDEFGLFGSVEINEDDQDAVNAWARVARGDVSQCSFGFDILDDFREDREDGWTVFHLRSVQLYEVSICTFPAYEDTGVVVKQRRAELDDVKKRKAEAWKAETLKKLKGGSDGAQND